MSRLKAHWGDPPKPNLWQVDSSLEFVEVTSPFLAGGSILLTSPGYNGTDRYQIGWLPSPARRQPNLIAVLDSQTYSEALRFFLSPEGWRKIKEKDLGVGWMFTHKVASSSLKPQWGNPPKPNIWQVKIKEDEETVEVTSPILKYGGRFALIRITPDKNYWQISFLSSTDRFTLTGFKADSFEEARDIFLSPRGWGLIKHFRKPHQDIFKSKVASSNLRAHWGDPPKPNLWKVTDAPASINDFSYCMVSSPAFKDNGYLQLQWDNEDDVWIVYHNSDTVKERIVYIGFDYKSYREARDIFLSPRGWKNIKRGMQGYFSDIFSVPKVASSTLKAMWGNPPKPNLWKVTGVNSIIAKFSHCMVSSPIFKDNGYLQLQWDAGDDIWVVYYSSDTARSRLVYFTGHETYAEARDEFLSRIGWEKIKRRMPDIFSVPKVASKDF